MPTNFRRFAPNRVFFRKSPEFGQFLFYFYLKNVNTPVLVNRPKDLLQNIRVYFKIRSPPMHKSVWGILMSVVVGSCLVIIGIFDDFKMFHFGLWRSSQSQNRLWKPIILTDFPYSLPLKYNRKIVDPDFESTYLRRKWGFLKSANSSLISALELPRFLGPKVVAAFYGGGLVQ